MRAVRGDQISMIFQEPMTSLNPVYTVGSQIVEAIRLHRSSSRREAHARAVEMLRLVGIPSPEESARLYPHGELPAGSAAVMIAHGAVVRSEPPHRRRADDGARRDHSGADPRAGCGSCRARWG